MALAFPSPEWEQLGAGTQRPWKQEAPLIVIQWSLRPQAPIIPPPGLAPLPSPLQVLPHSSRQQETPAAAQTSNSSSLWAGGVGGEARGQRVKVSFVPAGGGEGPRED